MSMFAEPATRIREQVKSSASAIKGQLDATGKTIADEAAMSGEVVKEEVSAAVGGKIEEVKAGAADRLSRASETIEQRARNASSPRYRGAAEQLASGLGQASTYVREKKLSDAGADIRANMSQNPGRWICAALAVGFLTGVCVDGFTRRGAGREEC